MDPVAQVAMSLFGGSLQSPGANTAAQATSSTLATGGPIPATGQAAVAPAPFADLITEAVGQVEQLEGQAKTATEGLMAGTGVDVHEAMIATEKAEMGFDLVLAVRNKALAAYQQVMGMQF